MVECGLVFGKREFEVKRRREKARKEERGALRNARSELRDRAGQKSGQRPDDDGAASMKKTQRTKENLAGRNGFSC